MKIEIEIGKETFPRAIKKARTLLSKLDGWEIAFIISVLFISAVALAISIRNSELDIERAEMRAKQAAEKAALNAQIGQKECANLISLGYAVENCPEYSPWHHVKSDGGIEIRYFVGDVIGGGYIFRVSSSSSSATILSESASLSVGPGETKYFLQKYQLPEPEIVLTTPQSTPATTSRQPTRIRVPNPNYSWIECTLVGGPNSAWPQCDKTIEIIVP
jgi:hypothetical protein